MESSNLDGGLKSSARLLSLKSLKSVWPSLVEPHQISMFIQVSRGFIFVCLRPGNASQSAEPAQPGEARESSKLTQCKIAKLCLENFNCEYEEAICLVYVC